jgi:NAD(P)-dependent dehydrogenase (short-subunit alcohol dehydrogenase family)
MSNWSTKDIPSQAGKTAIVTGANSGIGYYTALELGRAGASVVVACRNRARGFEAVQKMLSEAPGASFVLELLDLADLSSVRAFSDKFLGNKNPLDILVNNAGIMAVPSRETTVDGFELQFGTNHLGHFALTGLLLPALHQSKAPRVVSVSSGVAFWGELNIDDLQSEKKYEPMTAYAQSKLANLLFMLELGRQHPWLNSVAAHPGSTQTNLQKYKFKRLVKIFGQPASVGALPLLRAAVDETEPGTFFAPNGPFQMWGAPIEVSLPKQSLDRTLAYKLWRLSEDLTSIKYAY